MYLLCVESDYELPGIIPGSFDDRPFQLELYAELTRRHEEMLRRDAEIAGLAQSVSSLNEDLANRDAEIARLNETLAGAAAESERMAGLVAGRQAELESCRMELTANRTAVADHAKKVDELQ